MFLAVFFRTFHKKSPNVTVRESLLQTESENLLVTYSPFLDYKKNKKVWQFGVMVQKKAFAFPKEIFQKFIKKIVLSFSENRRPFLLLPIFGLKKTLFSWKRPILLYYGIKHPLKPTRNVRESFYLLEKRSVEFYNVLQIWVGGFCKSLISCLFWFSVYVGQ